MHGLIYLDHAATALEAGTLNIHSLAGLRASLSYIKEQGADVLMEEVARAIEAVREIAE